MIAVQSLYTQGADKCFRFSSEQDMKNCMKLSAILAKQHFGKVIIYTDCGGRELIAEFASIYDEIHLDLEGVFVSSQYWAYSKVLVYKALAERGEPFIHLDNDVLLLGSIPKEILSSAYFFQGRELLSYPCHYFYKSAYREFRNYLSHLMPECPDFAINTGVFAIRDFTFLHHYILEIEKFIIKTQSHKYIDDTQSNHLSVVFEQLLLNCFINQGITNYLLQDDFTPKTRYTHLIGESKKYEKIMQLVNDKLMAYNFLCPSY